MPKLVRRSPKYRLHRASGQAIVVLDGRTFYLGPWKSEASLIEYDRLIGEWLVGGRRLPTASCDITVTELIFSFWQHVKRYYVHADGAPTSEQACVHVCLAPVRERYGASPAKDFGPVALKAIRQQFIDSGICRRQVNARVNRIRRMFRWGVAEELVPATVLHALEAVEGLRAGRCDAKEREPVRPVPDAWVEAVLPHVSRQVATMIELQQLTGARPGEVCSIRACDIDMSGEVWLYEPPIHKNLWRGQRRIIPLGPRAQELLRPWLQLDTQAYLFSPADAEKERNAERRTQRRSKMTPSQSKRRPKKNPKRPAGTRYTSTSYRRAIARGCVLADQAAHELRPDVPAEQALIPTWAPNRIRHARATEIRRKFGLEAAQVSLGHKAADVTQVYAERDLELAIRVAREVG